MCIRDSLNTGDTGTGAYTFSGGIFNINASSNFATNINTGTSTGTVTIGGGGGTVAIDSSFWDITTAGVVSGLTGFTSSGTINLSGLTASRIVATDASKNLVSTITAANLLASVTGTTGTNNLVFSTSPTFETSITTPLVIGGTAIGSNIIYKSTTGAGTATGIAHQFTGGTNGATVIETMLNNGNVGIGTIAPGSKLQISTGNSEYLPSTSGFSLRKLEEGY